MIRRVPLHGWLMLVVGTLPGCSLSNYQYTGQTSIHSIRVPKDLESVGANVADFGTPGAAFVESSIRDPEETRYFRDLAFEEPGTRTLTISINRCHVKYLADPGPSKEILAFVTVTDHADNKKYKRVFFDSEFAVEGAYLNFSGKTVYGPRPYAGRPITIDFYIAELDQKENEVAIEAIRQIKKTLALVGPQVSLASNLVTDIATSLIKTNVDDRELQFSYELKPVTYEVPSGADIRMGGNLLRTGNYVVVKQEFRRSDADWPSLMSFEDELSFPKWLGGDSAIKLASQYPNIVYLGGQLYVTRAFVRKMHDISSGASSASSIRRKLTPLWSLGDSSPERMRRALLKLNEQLTVEALKETMRTKLTPSKNDYVFPNTLFGAATEKDVENFRKAEGYGDPPKSTDPPDKKNREGPDVVDIQDFVLANYVPYTSKSYLSFTVRDDLSAGEASALSEVEGAAAKRVSDVVFALSAADQKAIIGAIGGALRTAVVRAIVRNELRSAKDKAAMATKEAELKKRFGEAFHSEIALEFGYRSSMIARLETKTGIKDLLGAMAKNALKGDVTKRIKDVLPVLRQDFPALARFGEEFLKELDVKEPLAGEDEDAE